MHRSHATTDLSMRRDSGVWLFWSWLGQLKKLQTIILIDVNRASDFFKNPSSNLYTCAHRYLISKLTERSLVLVVSSFVPQNFMFKHLV